MNPLTKVPRQLIVAISVFTMVAVSAVMAAGAAHSTRINSAVVGDGFLGDRLGTKVGASPNELAPVSINRSASEITFTTIDVPSALFTEPAGINDRGQIVGDYLDVGGTSHGFLLDNGTFTTIDVPGFTFTVASGINDRGQIVGF